jgi:hypothetical protein
MKFHSLAVALAALLFPTLASAVSTITLQQGVAPSVSYAGTVDTFVSSANAANNFGGAGALAISAATAVAPANTKGEFQSLIRFDLSPAKAAFDAQFGVGAWALSSAQLQLTATSPNNSIFNGNGTLTNTAGNIDVLWMASDAWVEGSGKPSPLTTGGLSYSTLSTFTGGSDQALGTFAFGGATSGNTIFILGLGSGLLADAVGGTAASFLLKASSGSLVSALFNSRDFGSTASARPALTLSAVAAPEPGRASLLMMAAGAMIFRRRRSA